MAETKYGKYFIKEPIEIGKFAPNLRFSSEFPKTDFTIRWHCVAGPWLMEEKPHSHDFDQFSCFLGGNPMDIRDFGAEIEIFLGEEGEKHIINTTTVIFVPRGLIHGPLNFKRVDKPVMFINVPLASKYIKKQI
jgi:hypothetical protein